MEFWQSSVCSIFYASDFVLATAVLHVQSLNRIVRWALLERNQCIWGWWSCHSRISEWFVSNLCARRVERCVKTHFLGLLTVPKTQVLYAEHLHLLLSCRPIPQNDPFGPYSLNLTVLGASIRKFLSQALSVSEHVQEGVEPGAGERGQRCRAFLVRVWSSCGGVPRGTIPLFSCGRDLSVRCSFTVLTLLAPRQRNRVTSPGTSLRRDPKFEL